MFHIHQQWLLSAIFCPVSQYCEILLCLVTASFTFYYSEFLSIWVTVSCFISQTFSRSFQSMLSNIGPRTDIRGTPRSSFVMKIEHETLPSFSSTFYLFLTSLGFPESLLWGNLSEVFQRSSYRPPVSVCLWTLKCSCRHVQHDYLHIKNLFSIDFSTHYLLPFLALVFSPIFWYGRQIGSSVFLHTTPQMLLNNTWHVLCLW